jgi:hypothetical protein
VHLPFSTIYFDLWPRLKDSFLKDGIRIRIWSCLKNAQRQRSTKNTKGFFLAYFGARAEFVLLITDQQCVLIMPCVRCFPRELELRRGGRCSDG